MTETTKYVFNPNDHYLTSMGGKVVRIVRKMPLEDIVTTVAARALADGLVEAQIEECSKKRSAKRPVTKYVTFVLDEASRALLKEVL